MRTWEDIHARFFMGAISDDVMSQSELTTIDTIPYNFSNIDGGVAHFLLVSSDLMQFPAGLGALFFSDNMAHRGGRGAYNRGHNRGGNPRYQGDPPGAGRRVQQQDFEPRAPNVGAQCYDRWDRPAAGKL